MNPRLEALFLEALEQNQQKLLRVCSVYARDADDRKDLFQEALINIWQSLPTFEEKSSLSTWMFRITLNVCLRLQARQAKSRDRFKKLDSLTIERVAAAEDKPEENEQVVRLRQCIQKLNEADKAITTLYLEELSYREIAEITGITENSVAVKIKRIKMKLLTCLNEGL